jgi:hypothetical protein
MAVSQQPSGDALARTILTGILADQAALMGVLESLFELHTTLLTVNRLSDKEFELARPELAP